MKAYHFWAGIVIRLSLNLDQDWLRIN